MLKNAFRHSRILLAAVIILMLLPAGLEVIAQEATPEATPSATATSETGAAVDTGLASAIRQVHSFVRWLVIITTVVAIVKLGLGLIQNAEYDLLAQRIMLTFSMLISLQWAVGLIFLIVYGSIIGFGHLFLWEHAGVMTVAVAISNMHTRWKNADSRTRYRNGLLIVIGVLVLVVIGISVLPYNAWHLVP